MTKCTNCMRGDCCGGDFDELKAELEDTVTECLAAKSNEDIMRKQLAELREAASSWLRWPTEGHKKQLAALLQEVVE